MYTEDNRYPFVVGLEEKDQPQKVEIWKWCVEQWGRPRHNNLINWDTGWHYGDYIFKFVNEKDRTLFLLRWS
jgi:hypothetical protein